MNKDFFLFNFLDSFLNFLTISKRLSKNTISAYNSDLVDFFDFLKNQEINKFSSLENAELFQDYFTNLRQRLLKKNSFSRKYSCINSFLNFLVDEKCLTNNVILNIKKPKLEKKIPKFLDFKLIEDFLNFKMKDETKYNILKNIFIIFLSYSGLRVSELCALKLKDIQILIEKIIEKKLNQKNAIQEDINEQKFLLIKIKGKGEKERMVPFFLKNLDFLEKYLLFRERTLKNQKSDYLFNSMSKEGCITRRYVFKILDLFIKEFNFNIKIHPHIFRHSFATNLLKQGLDLRSIQELLGHSSISTTAIYTQITDDQLVETLKKHPIQSFD